MLMLFKELGDRFIEFVLALVKGETLEKQLTSALKSTIFLISILGFAVTSLLVSNISLRLDLADMEVGMSKVNILFDTEKGGPIKGFIRINDVLSDQNAAARQENIVLLTKNIKVTEENRWLRFHLLKVLQETNMLRANNEVLLQKCAPRHPRN